MNNNQSLHVVEVNGKKMLLGATQSSVTVLKDLGEVKNSNNDVTDFTFEQEILESSQKVEEEKQPIDF